MISSDEHGSRGRQALHIHKEDMERFAECQADDSNCCLLENSTEPVEGSMIRIPVPEPPEFIRSTITAGRPLYFCTLCVVVGHTEEKQGVCVKVHFGSKEVAPSIQSLADLMIDRVSRTINRIPQRHLLRLWEIWAESGLSTLIACQVRVTLNQSADGVVAWVHPCIMTPEIQQLASFRNAGEHLRTNIASSLKDRWIN